MSALDRLGRSDEQFRGLIASLGEDDWSAGTPCDGWDVEAVVRHVVAGVRAFAQLLTEGGYDIVAIRAAADEIPRADLLTSYDEGEAALVAALSAPGVLDTTYDSPVGPMTGEDVADLRALEQVAHGWDIGTALGRELTISEDDADALIAYVARLKAGLPRDRAPFAEPTPVAPDATPLARLLGAVGR